MLTRSAKRKSVHTECDPLLLQVSGNEIHIQSQSSISVKGSGSVPLCNEQLQESIFNIHIHSPPVHEIRNVKISMPGTHSPVQVSFNEVHKTLEFNIGNNSGKLTPILGAIQLSFENGSEKRNCLELGSNTPCQKCLTDIKKGSSKGSKDRYSTKTEKNSNKTFKNTKKISSYSVDIDSIKLNKPVVVLTDICKSKYYKSIFTDQTPKVQVDTSGIGTENDFSGIKVKQENSSTGDIDNCCTNILGDTLNTSPSLESVHSSSLSGSMLLTQLAEGCSFSEILNRFRIKNGNCLVDTLKCADTVNHENFETECLEGHDNLVLKSERVSFSEDEATTGGFLTSEITEKIESMDFEDSKLLDLPQGSDCEESRENVEHLRDHSLDSHMISDINKNTTAVHSFSEDVTAGEGISDSSCLTSDVVFNKCNLIISEEISIEPETSDNHKNITNNSNLKLHESSQPSLEMDKEIMKGKKFLGVNKSKSKKKKRSKSTPPKPSHSASPKNMKQSNRKSNSSRSKIKLPDEYIPLNVSGPTKFGVAMLNQIKPYVHHDAKDFKNKMLFGDRIKRVSLPEHWRMYKLKQKANRSVRG